MKKVYYPDLGKYDAMSLPCGGVAYYDYESSTHSYRCAKCFAVVGSIGMPKQCNEEMIKWDNWEKMGGKGWDYFAEVEDIYEDVNNV